MQVDFTQREGESQDNRPAETVEIPKGYLCPLTQHIMHDPVIFFDDGLTYEREALTDWLKNNKTNPLTKQALKQTGTFPNGALKGLIQTFLTTHGHRPAVQACCYVPKQQRLDQAWLSAARKGDIKALKQAYAKGANPLAIDKQGNTACHKAGLSDNPINTLKAIYDLTKGHADVPLNDIEDQKAEELPAASNPGLDAGTERALRLMRQSNHQGQTVLHVTVTSAKLAWAQRLIPHLITTYGLDVAAKNKAGQTALHDAAKQSAKPLMRLLIQAEASPDSPDNQKKTLLKLAPKLAHWMRDEYHAVLKQTNQQLKRTNQQLTEKHQTQTQRLLEIEEKLCHLDASNKQLMEDKAKAEKQAKQLTEQLNTAETNHQAILALKTQAIQSLQQEKTTQTQVIQQLKASNAKLNQTLNTMQAQHTQQMQESQHALTQLKQDKVTSEKRMTALKMTVKNSQAILVLKEQDIEQLQEDKRQLTATIKALNVKLSQQENEEKSAPKDNVADKLGFFEKPVVKIDAKHKRAIQTALAEAQKTKEFTALTPYINKKTARYIQSLVYNSTWLEGYFAPNPQHDYTKDVIPKVEINDDKVVIRNNKKGHEKFSWPFKTSETFDLYKHIWRGEEKDGIRLKHTGPVYTEWNKRLYDDTNAGDPDKKNNGRPPPTSTRTIPIFDRQGLTKGITGADWVGTEKRGLVKMTYNFCEVMQSLRQVEKLGQAVNSAPKFVKQ